MSNFNETLGILAKLSEEVRAAQNSFEPIPPSAIICFNGLLGAAVAPQTLMRLDPFAMCHRGSSFPVHGGIGSSAPRSVS